MKGMKNVRPGWPEPRAPEEATTRLAGTSANDPLPSLAAEIMLVDVDLVGNPNCSPESSMQMAIIPWVNVVHRVCDHFGIWLGCGRRFRNSSGIEIGASAPIHGFFQGHFAKVPMA